MTTLTDKLPRTAVIAYQNRELLTNHDSVSNNFFHEDVRYLIHDVPSDIMAEGVNRSNYDVAVIAGKGETSASFTGRQLFINQIPQSVFRADLARRVNGTGAPWKFGPYSVGFPLSWTLDSTVHIESNCMPAKLCIISHSCPHIKFWFTIRDNKNKNIYNHIFKTFRALLNSQAGDPGTKSFFIPRLQADIDKIFHKEINITLTYEKELQYVKFSDKPSDWFVTEVFDQNQLLECLMPADNTASDFAEVIGRDEEGLSTLPLKQIFNAFYKHGTPPLSCVHLHVVGDTIYLGDYHINYESKFHPYLVQTVHRAFLKNLVDMALA